ncbi:hypothetical protein OG429_40185 (plasmid) [Streptomyces sp. NBC_00190]|uniref:hypothetical protein n=1 Tax=unclassified Streptomyces TaxID=2593676 RepID=UPI002E2D51E8|nr:hypothetical protein [Streptomyces sp. NBC_00190]
MRPRRNRRRHHRDHQLGGTDALPYVTATTLITMPIALTAGNFITYQPLVTAGTWIATTAGLL